MATFFGPGSLTVPLVTLATIDEALQATQTFKTENGMQFPRAAYALNDGSPSEWKLRLWETPTTKVTARQVGMAVAALGKGFRGNKVAIPSADLPAVKRTVLHAWYLVHPEAKPDEVPTILKSHEASTHGVEGVAPPGWEKSVRKMKKDQGIDNPFALAWYMKNQHMKPHKPATDMDASFDAAVLMAVTQLRVQALAPIFQAAARGDAWAQMRLLDASTGPILQERRW